MDVQSVFFFGDCFRCTSSFATMSISTLTRILLGVFKKATCGTQDAPQVRAKEVQKVMEGFGLRRLGVAPRQLIPEVRAQEIHDHVGQGGRGQVFRADNRVGHFEVEGNERHVQPLMQELSMQHCKNVDTPISKAGQDPINTGEELNEDEARSGRRAIAQMNHMAQVRPDLSVAVRVMSQYVSKPLEGTVPVIKPAIRSVQALPSMSARCVEHCSREVRDQCVERQ